MASAAVSSASSDITPRVIKVLTGADSGTSGRITLPMRSVRVRMPARRSPPSASASTTMIEPTCAWCMRPKASRSGVSGAHVRGLRARTSSRERGVHRALGARLGGVGRLQLLARQIEQRAEAALAEVEEGRTALRQILEARARQHQAEGIGHRSIHQRHRAAGQQRADRKAIADSRLERCLARGRGLALHSALLDDVTVGRRLVRRRQDRFARLEVRDFDVLEDEIQVLGRHA